MRYPSPQNLQGVEHPQYLLSLSRRNQRRLAFTKPARGKRDAGVAYLEQDPSFAGYARLIDFVRAGLPEEEGYRAEIALETIGLSGDIPADAPLEAGSQVEDVLDLPVAEVLETNEVGDRGSSAHGRQDSAPPGRIQGDPKPGPTVA